MKLTVSYKQRKRDDKQVKFTKPDDTENETIFNKTFDCTSEEVFKKPLSDLLMEHSINPLVFQIVAIKFLDSYYDY